VRFKHETIALNLREMAYTNGGVKGRRKDAHTAKDEELHYEGGIAEFVGSVSKGSAALHDVIFVKGMREGIDVEVALQWTDAVHETIFTYANNIHTVEGGTHLSGLKAALTRTLNDYARKNKVLKESDPSLTGDDTREGLTAIVSGPSTSTILIRTIPILLARSTSSMTSDRAVTMRSGCLWSAASVAGWRSSRVIRGRIPSTMARSEAENPTDPRT